MKAVRIVRDPETIKLLADLVRREVMRLIAVEPLTQTQLAERMMLSNPSMSHHLQLLRKAGLIRIKRAKIGSHGILEKYYEPKAKLFLEDWEKIPPYLRRYFVHSYMERLRGILSVIQLIKEKQGRNIEVTPEQLEGLSLEIARQISIVGKQYEAEETDINRETLLVKIYSETLRKIVAEHKWPLLDIPEIL